MSRYTATIFSINELGLHASMGGFSSNYRPQPEHYEWRVEYDINPSKSANQIMAEAWDAYQNIDETRRCPDGGRSMMMGDVMRISGPNFTEFYICAAMDWKRVKDPWTERELQRVAAIKKALNKGVRLVNLECE